MTTSFALQGALYKRCTICAARNPCTQSVHKAQAPMRSHRATLAKRAWRLHIGQPMRARPLTKLIAILLAPAMLVMGAAQGLLLVRCGSTVRMSCCCPKDSPTSDAPSMAPSEECCARLSIPNVPAQTTNSVASAVPAPALIAAVAPMVSVDLVVERIRPRTPHLDPPPIPSRVLANCAFLI